jgi:hypothetical protein
MKTLSTPADLAAIRDRILLLTPADARVWGSMSCHQMVCHLADAFGCPLGERAAAPVKRPPIPLPLYKWLALRMPMKWPQGVPTPPEMNQFVGGTPPVEFAADAARLIDRLEVFVGSSGPWAAHPLFGVMTTEEWMRWGYLHTDHHLRQFGR